MVAAAWLSISAIVAVTILPIGLRPATGFSPNIERFLAMAIVGGLFVLAYPTRFWVIVAVLPQQKPLSATWGWAHGERWKETTR